MTRFAPIHYMYSEPPPGEEQRDLSLRPATSNSWLSGAVARCQAADPTFPRVTAHDLRHTAASLAISAGANPKVVQRMLGHASAAMTLDVYADLFDSDLESVAENVSRMCPRWSEPNAHSAPKTL